MTFSWREDAWGLNFSEVRDYKRMNVDKNMDRSKLP
jgi:hypothetical protein